MGSVAPLLAFLLMVVSGWLHRQKHYLIIDRDGKYTDQFRRFAGKSGYDVIGLPPMSPNLNAYPGRFGPSIKDECLDRMIFVGQTLLRRALAHYVAHYHPERNHQGLENRLIRAEPSRGASEGAVHRSPLPGGMLDYYHRATP